MNRVKLLCLVAVVFFAGNSLIADSTNPSIMSGDFLKEHKSLEGNWFGGKNFTPRLCPRGFYTGRAKVKGLFENVKMDLSAENEMDIYASIVDASGRVEGEYLGDLSSCLNVSASGSIAADRVEVRAKVTIPDNAEKVSVKVYYLKVGRLDFGKFVPTWFEQMATDSLNQALVYVWQTCLGEWLNQRFSDYFNSLQDKRGI
ncbi:hypothetical protein EBQ74_06605 [bacterium]|nr:hypothetical protein [bacterium]